MCGAFIASDNVHGDTLKNGDDDLPSSTDAPGYYCRRQHDPCRSASVRGILPVDVKESMRIYFIDFSENLFGFQFFLLPLLL